MDEDMVEQILMSNNDRSEEPPGNGCSAGGASSTGGGGNGGFKESSAMQKRLQRLSRNVSEAIASLKNSLYLESLREPPSDRVETCRKHVWGSVVRGLTQLYPGSQLPEKLVSNIRKHYDSFPLRFSISTVFSVNLSLQCPSKFQSEKKLAMFLHVYGYIGGSKI